MQKSSTVKNLSMGEGGMLAIRRGLEDERTEASGTLQTATRDKERERVCVSDGERSKYLTPPCVCDKQLLRD